jgi:outer membrane protein TolC
MMRIRSYSLAFCLLAGAGATCLAAGNNPPVADSAGTNILVIDLPATLSLVGTRSLDPKIARQKIAAAKALEETAAWRFSPAIVPGVGYRRHDNLIQDVAGHVIDVQKDSYTIGPAISLQLDLGDAIYAKLATHQQVKAAEYDSERQDRDSTIEAIHAYYNLARAAAAMAVLNDAVRIAEDYANQLRHAVDTGIAFKGDAIRATAQIARNQITVRRGQEQLEVSTAQLAKTLHLEPTLRLAVPADELVPLAITATNAPLDSLVARALTLRPEVLRNRARTESARRASQGAKYAPIIPTIGGQVFAGGLGGGPAGAPGAFGESEDYQFTLGWRIGPGGLLDRGRVHATEAQLRLETLEGEKQRDEIVRDVIESRARVASFAEQLSLARQALELSTEALKLVSQRQDFAVGIVLERIQAEEDFTRARLEYLTAVAGLNAAQFDLLRATGDQLRAPTGK